MRRHAPTLVISRRCACLPAVPARFPKVSGGFLTLFLTSARTAPLPPSQHAFADRPHAVSSVPLVPDTAGLANIVWTLRPLIDRRRVREPDSGISEPPARLASFSEQPNCWAVLCRIPSRSDDVACLLFFTYPLFPSALFLCRIAHSPTHHRTSCFGTIEIA